MASGSSPHSGVDELTPTTTAQSTDAASINNNQIRVRSSRACTHCSQRKAKCDGASPCSACVRGGHQCVYTQPKKRGPPKGAPARGGVKKRVPKTEENGSEDALMRSTPAGADRVEHQWDPSAWRAPTATSSYTRPQETSSLYNNGVRPLQSSYPVAEWRHAAEHGNFHPPARPVHHSYPSSSGSTITSPPTDPRQQFHRRNYSYEPHLRTGSTLATSPHDAALPMAATSATPPERAAAYAYRTDASSSSTSPFQYQNRTTNGVDFVLPQRDRTPSDHSPSTSFWPTTSDPPPPTLSDRPSSQASFINDRRKAEDYLPSEVIQRLLDIYQAFVHPHWPIVYLPSLTSLSVLRTTKPILFEAILAVASATFDSHHDASDKDLPSTQLDLFFDTSSKVEHAWSSGELCAHFVNRVKARILDGKFERSISTIQAAILVGVVEMGSGNNSSSWHFGGIACRMALDMNLHRDAMLTGRMSNADVQEQRRTLWACFILDKILCTAFEKPVQLRSAEIETELPSVYERDEYDLWLNETTRPFVPDEWKGSMEGVKVHAMSSFHAWVEVMDILESILDQVYSPRAKDKRRRTSGESDWEVLCSLDKALSTWRSSLPDHLKWNDNLHRSVGPHVLTMRGWYCICIILLHRPRVPQLLRPRRNSSPPFGGTERLTSTPGLEICTAAAREVCDILSVYDTTFRIRKIPSSWVYLIFQGATIHSALAARRKKEEDESPKYLSQCVRFLNRIGRTWRSASHHVATLENLCRTRPSSPELELEPEEWTKFWNEMPLSSEDEGHWASFMKSLAAVQEGSSDPYLASLFGGL